ncbi:Tfp pilus assembly protein FimT/FimU [Candidatus Dependentiae bacterium]
MRKSKGFTLIEILIVLVVIAGMATIITSSMQNREPASEVLAVLSEFNDLIVFARQESISKQKTYRLTFQSNAEHQDLIKIEVEYDDPEKLGKKLYKQIFSPYFKTQYDLPESVKMKAIFKSDKKDEFEENKGQAYCYLIPSGLVEPIMVHIIKKIDDRQETVTFIMEPFKGEFELTYGFVRPTKTGISR